jgi:ribose/xylose/arabinose/galactoside ABC-type transport system permease subunit
MSTTVGDLRRRLRRRSDVRIVLILVVTLVLVEIFTSGVLDSVDQVLVRASTTGVVALGLTVVIIQGNLDLSVGSTLAFAAIITVKVSEGSIWLGLVLALASGALVGVVNAVIVTRLKVNSFIGTLGTMTALSGVNYIVTGGGSISGGSLEASLAITDTFLGFLTGQVLVFVVAAVLLHLVLSRTRTGRDFYAVGGNQPAAAAAGIPVNRRVNQGFVLCGLTAGAGGWILATGLGTASPIFGTNTALLAIAAVIVGGASLTGGRGTVIGTVLGMLTIALLGTALDIAGITSSYQQIATGLILFLVVAADKLSTSAAFLDRVRARLRPPQNTAPIDATTPSTSEDTPVETR